ncbi:hypothetical protein BDQ17DRAFT_1327764 [Cyathus striatus]|nr:hypothetical protein BDQ17DRAFT_1327764 [Cyathus striatus]
MAVSTQTVRMLRCTESISALITLYDHMCTIDSESRYIGDFLTICATAFYIIPWGTSLLLYLCQVTAGDVIRRQKFEASVLEGLHSGASICLVFLASTSHKLSAYWTAIILFETILFSLTLWKFMFDLRHTLLIRRFSLIKLVVRDSLIYYSLAFALYLIVGLMWSVKPLSTDFTSLGVPWQRYQFSAQRVDL